MLLSIIVPVYNVRDLVLKCLDSINNQTFTDYEVIIIDDGSTDGSEKLVDEYCLDKEKFHVIHKTNGGLMSAWMEGVKHAAGQYFGFVDSDDFIHPEMYNKMMEKAIEYDCDIVMCDRFDIVGEKITVISSPIEAGYYDQANMHIIYEKTLPKFYSNHITNARWNKIFKRDLFLNATKYCAGLSRICEDRYITPPCMFAAKSFYYLNTPLYYYVLREGSNHSMPSPKLKSVISDIYHTQKRMINDLRMEGQYGELVDRAYLNLLYLLIRRNFSGKGDIAYRLKLAREVFDDEELIQCVDKHKTDLTGKLGNCLRIVFFLRSPLLFVFICSLS